jgi:prepilin-type N-terminal cleavage/methylation domain-containing protein
MQGAEGVSVELIETTKVETDKETKMKTNKQKKSGFTLVELMVVAIIVAILAAVAIPLMTGNKDRAMATEGQAGCTTIATQLRMHWAEFGNYADVVANDPTSLQGINDDDLNGTYFDDGSYNITTLTDGDDYTIQATGKTGGDADGETIIMTVTSGDAVWSGTLLGDAAP